MLLREERRKDLVYEELKNKVIVQLEGSESASVTKLVNMYKDWDRTYEAYKALANQAREMKKEAEFYKTSYEEELRSMNEKYFDVVGDAAKTKVIRSMRYAIKISKESESHENKETDWEKVVEELAEVMQIPVDVLQKAIDKYTTVEMITPRARLYKPEDLQAIENQNESVASNGKNNWFRLLLMKIKIFYEKLLKKFQIFDNIMDSIEKKYSL